MMQAQIMSLCLKDIESPLRRTALVSRAGHFVVVGSATDAVDGEAEGELWVAVYGDVKEVRDSDGFGGGEAEQEGGCENLHCGFEVKAGKLVSRWKRVD
jgi:hypothetical protein